MSLRSRMIAASLAGAAMAALTASASAQAPAAPASPYMGMNFVNIDGFKYGGQIPVGTDKTNLEAIRAHLPHIVMMFSDGNFDAPMLVHDTNVPGTDDLARLHAVVTWRYVETPGGGRIDIVTTRPDAIAAVHRFLAFQIADHRTADDAVVARRP